LDSTRLRYWNMDNEPEVWQSTHDDVVRDTIAAESYMQRYFAVAKAARRRFPGVKLCGPVFTNEWQWWNWNNSFISTVESGKSIKLSWMEYFILRVGQEQKASGIRLLDVLDVHFYPGTTNPHDITQLHRVYYDTTYAWPQANGCKRLPNGGWDAAQTKEYVFKRAIDWCTAHVGPGHGVGMGMTECGAVNTSNASLIAVWYASHLGCFADNAVELFTPWDWYPGQWEVLHLFRSSVKSRHILSRSSRDTLVSAYASESTAGDSLTIVLVNRDLVAAQTVNTVISGWNVTNGTHAILRLSNLPATETFVSKTQNALQKSTVAVINNTFSIALPGLSVTAVQLAGRTAAAVHRGIPHVNVHILKTIVRNGSIVCIIDNGGSFRVELVNIAGRTIARSGSIDGRAVFPSIGIPAGAYMLRVSDMPGVQKIFVK
jgi:hypothetical protein